MAHACATPYARIAFPATDVPRGAGHCRIARHPMPPPASRGGRHGDDRCRFRGGMRVAVGVAGRRPMGETHHTRLSGLDQSFLHFETPNAYMHVALTAVFDPGSLSVADGGIDFASIRSHIASRLH